MQQTTKYKLNLIEKTDTFSPDPLNENMQKVESAIATETAAGDAAEAAARKAADNALDTRVRVLEGRRFVVGTYVGTNSSQTISLGFTPIAVLVQGPSTYFAMAVTGRNYPSISIVTNGFTVSVSGNFPLNDLNVNYGYLAIL